MLAAAVCLPTAAAAAALLLLLSLQNAENEMAIIAAYYGLPTLSVRAAVFHQMLRNQKGYQVGTQAPCRVSSWLLLGMCWGGCFPDRISPPSAPALRQNVSLASWVGGPPACPCVVCPRLPVPSLLRCAGGPRAHRGAGGEPAGRAVPV